MSDNIIPAHLLILICTYICISRTPIKIVKKQLGALDNYIV